MKSLIKFFLPTVLILFIISCTHHHYDPYDDDTAYESKTPHSYRLPVKGYKVLSSSKNYKEKGYASWYGRRFHHKRTSSGERYNMYRMTAAHRTLPLSTYVKVTNLRNGRHVIVRINDRGPYVSNRLIDLSYAAAKKLGIVGRGVAAVHVEAIKKRA